jgi:cytochrome c556
MKDMIESSESLKKAVQAGDTKAVKGAAGKLNQSCNECHGKFRDS